MNTHLILIVGDFNAKSIEWVSARTEKRRNLISDMVARRDLIFNLIVRIHNQLNFIVYL